MATFKEIAAYSAYRMFFSLCIGTILTVSQLSFKVCALALIASVPVSFLTSHQENNPCNEYPLKPHFYIVKLGYTGVYLFFLFLLQNIDCGYSLEPPRRGGSNVYPQSMF